ncbi:GTPase HflX [Entomobacter blattae]|uniref:GTPase HflX n=1 Tax=Entomobacter blattae TaxID=2762277 RepID=A0A7H1NT53_9PROT|nr:GTPase HflX [Entomobacter blattae]QNT78963.1 GTPase HflX [Entomobacter blattae]
MGTLEKFAETTKAAVILPWKKSGKEDNYARNAESRLEEAIGLTRSIGVDIAYSQIVVLRSRRPATLIGIGQIEALREEISSLDIALVVIDAAITPVQQRNLEKALEAKVIDRTALILDIFGERAVTKEGSLQVELAHLEYQRSRLVRSWTHLERQRGGFGFMGGPGETQIESDRRMIGQRITRLKEELEQVRRTRGLHRQARKKVPFPIVTLVGYTNAGKSTLFNKLTGSSVKAQDQLFATLDPTMRAVTLPSGSKIILSDTVGFISDLPTELVAAFRATLEEIAYADVILHVRDLSNPDSQAQKQDVVKVLEGMEREGLLAFGWQKLVVEVLNKIDHIEGIDIPVDNANRVAVSALTGQGLESLLTVIDQKLMEGADEKLYRFSIAEGEALAWLYQHGEVIERLNTESEITIRVRLSQVEQTRFEQKFSILPQTTD